jgi:hypothetical protein
MFRRADQCQKLLDNRRIVQAVGAGQGVNRPHQVHEVGLIVGRADQDSFVETRLQAQTHGSHGIGSPPG